MTLKMLGLALILLSGCTTLTEAQLEARDYRRMEFRNQFIDDQARCRAQGRQFVVLANGGVDRNGIPMTRVPYHCS